MKGKRGELELAQFLRDNGFGDAARGVQYKGGEDSPDVVGVDGFHVECKRVETGNPYVWLTQAIRDAGGKVPFVAHRRNREEWIAVLRLSDLLALIRKYPHDAEDTR